MRRIVGRFVDAIARRAAARTAEHLFREPMLIDIQGTTSLTPLDVRKFAQIVAALEAGEFYCQHLYNADFFDSCVDHVAEMAALERVMRSLFPSGCVADED